MTARLQSDFPSPTTAAAAFRPRPDRQLRDAADHQDVNQRTFYGAVRLPEDKVTAVVAGRVDAFLIDFPNRIPRTEPRP
jgi:hypothetical protein